MRAWRSARRTAAVAGVAVAAAVLSACGGGPAAPAGGSGTAAGSTPASSSSPTASTAAQSPTIVAVTSAGALVTLDPATGARESTLVPSGVLGDEVSVSASGTVYFGAQDGSCQTNVESVPLSGGSPTVVAAAGSLPAISPDGLQLAYASQPVLAAGCDLNGSDLVSLYHLDVRTLGTGATRTMGMVAPSESSGLPFPISHVSWSPTGQDLAVSIAAVQDNEGWQVDLVNLALPAPYYLSGPGVTNVPPTGSPTPQQSYLREGVYLPDGDLFVSRACCAGFPEHNTSRLMWEVTSAGVLVHQVAIGYTSLDHTSLAVSSDGRWLLYLAGGDLYLSSGGATPRELTTGLLAAAFA